MQIDISDFVSRADACAMIPGKPSPLTVFRWMSRGIDTGGGNRIKLRSWMFGARLYTTRAAIMEFGEELRAARLDAAGARQAGKAALEPTNRANPARKRTSAPAEALAPKPGQRVRVTRGDDRHEQAVKRLRAKGIKI